MSRGLQRERDLVTRLRQDGWWAIRSPASKGDVDVVCVRKELEGDGTEVFFIECKSTSAGPWHSFGPKDRTALREAAEWAGATAYLVWWPPRQKPRWYGVDEWPP